MSHWCLAEIESCKLFAQAGLEPLEPIRGGAQREVIESVASKGIGGPWLLLLSLFVSWLPLWAVLQLCLLLPCCAAPTQAQGNEPTGHGLELPKL
jgi:hypothetical protein